MCRSSSESLIAKKLGYADRPKEKDKETDFLVAKRVHFLISLKIRMFK